MFYSLDLYLDPLATVSSRGCVSCMRLTIQRGNCSANDVNAGGLAGTPGWFATRLDLQEEQALGSPYRSRNACELYRTCNLASTSDRSAGDATGGNKYAIPAYAARDAAPP